MATRPIPEYHGKRMLARWLNERSGGELAFDARCVRLTAKDMESPETMARVEAEHSWLADTKLVVKPDQLIKRRGKHGLVGLNLSWPQVLEWIRARLGKMITIDKVSGLLDTFIVEPFVPHKQEEEVYIAIYNTREGETVLFHHEGGVDVGDVDAKAIKLDVPLSNEEPAIESFAKLLVNIPAPEVRARLGAFIKHLHEVFRMLHFSYLEINPLVVQRVGNVINMIPLDLAAKIDETAELLVGQKWGEVYFPAPFGRPLLPAEQRVHELDEKTGASLKLTVLNPNGRIWTLIAGGGASVVYADTVTDLGFGKDLAVYGEYSGDPSEELTFEYARSVLGLMTEAPPDPKGKVLLIGGGIANFTNVAATFQGIVRALKEFGAKLVKQNVRVFVRRGGPNFQAGLQMMRKCGEDIGVEMHVYGPEVNIVSIVPMGLGLIPILKEDTGVSNNNNNGNKDGVSTTSSPVPTLDDDEEEQEEVKARPTSSSPSKRQRTDNPQQAETAPTSGSFTPLFTPQTRAIVYGLQTTACQGMLDFDHISGRSTCSVAAMVFPFSGDHLQKFYYGDKERMIPVYKDLGNALRKHPDVTVFINFASFRSAYTATMEALTYASQIKTIAIIAEGIPEQQTRLIIKEAAKKGVTLIGPATVGAIRPGCMRIGNTGGMIDNIIAAKLYRPGSVAYVSKSGGMSNELNNIIAKHADGVREGVAIGGDRYPGSRFIDHVLRFNDDPDVKIICLLGEVGGTDEYEVVKALESKRVTKPVVAWCIGTCAKLFGFEVQFGHAGSLAEKDVETAVAKNEALKRAGAKVPKSFATFGETLGDVYSGLLKTGGIQPIREPPVPKLPMDYTWAKRLGLVRKPAAFVSTISDDRGEELVYAGMPISRVFQEDMGVGGVLGLLWFKRRLPKYACDFIETILMLTADHGPAVSGAHNTIVCARAGKGLVESLCSGLLTIGPRFGGALDDAAKMFTKAHDRGVSPKEWVNERKANNELIMGIGHKVKSVSNPDKRVQIVVEFAKKNFPSCPVLDFALEVEKITTRKKANLILNVDGAVACAFVDMMRSCGSFTREEADEVVELGTLNGLFVVGRSIGFVGHFLDQVRLKESLYRHPVDDIAYALPELMNPGDEGGALPARMG